MGARLSPARKTLPGTGYDGHIASRVKPTKRVFRFILGILKWLYQPIVEWLLRKTTGQARFRGWLVTSQTGKVYSTDNEPNQAHRIPPYAQSRIA